jgi:hypothetical protein
MVSGQLKTPAALTPDRKVQVRTWYEDDGPQSRNGRCRKEKSLMLSERLSVWMNWPETNGVLYWYLWRFLKATDLTQFRIHRKTGHAANSKGPCQALYTVNRIFVLGLMNRVSNSMNSWGLIHGLLSLGHITHLPKLFIICICRNNLLLEKLTVLQLIKNIFYL